MTDDVLLDRLRLARAAGIGPRTARLLAERFGPPERLLDRSPGELAALGVPPRLAQALRDAPPRARAAGELALARRLGWTVLCLGDPAYPEPLARIHDPPLTLTVDGELTAADQRAVAVVGARRATHEGRETARRLAAELASAGVTVVSGLARGVDAAAHEGALEAGGRTIAVLGSGLRRIHPPQHLELAARVARSGALLSELAADEGPRRHTFPQRNRIVAGLSEGILVVEAGPRSGALITADLGANEGRELFAVPGALSNPLAQGTNSLLQDGAHLVTCARDVLDVLYGVTNERSPSTPDCSPRPVDAPPAAVAAREAAPGGGARRAPERPEERDGAPPPGESQLDRMLLGKLRATRGRTVDALASDLDREPWELMTALGLLEIRGMVTNCPDGYRRR